MNGKAFLKSLISILFGLCLTNLALASFHKNSWPKWQVYNPLSQDSIAHQEWQDFLTHCVITNREGINLVDYPHLTKNDLNTLKQYISRMSKIHIVNYNRNEQLAFWLNLYNALVVKTIFDFYPIASVQDINISPGLFSVGPWGANLITIEGTELSLDDIQNRIIRPIWNDPRTHYALNDGAIGGANLSKKAFQGATVNEQLNALASSYVNSLRGVQIIDGKLIVSKIYDWYMDDFGGDEMTLINHISRYAKPRLKKDLQHINTINSYVYNWHLNSTIAAS